MYINGEYLAELTLSTLPSIIEAVKEMKRQKICYRRSEGVIRIEKYFQGWIRGHEVFDHLMDNLYAMEDIEDYGTYIIGSATLPDWIMGGELTSRLYVEELPNGDILTLRPLRNDDISTSDRRYQLEKGKHDDKIVLVRRELERLRRLAAMKHPFNASLLASVPARVETDREKQHRLHRRQKFPL